MKTKIGKKKRYVPSQEALDESKIVRRKFPRKRKPAGRKVPRLRCQVFRWEEIPEWLTALLERCRHVGRLLDSSLIHAEDGLRRNRWNQ